MIPILDSTRSLILNQCLLARDSGTAEGYTSISIGTLGHLGLSTVSPTQWEKAEEAFDTIVALYAAWLIDVMPRYPRASPVEWGLDDPDWDEGARTLAKSINSALNFLIALSFLRNWTSTDRVALDRIAQGGVTNG